MAHFDDFDTKIQPEELFEEPMLMPEDIQDDNPTDWDFEELQWKYMNGEYPDEE